MRKSRHGIGKTFLTVGGIIAAIGIGVGVFKAPPQDSLVARGEVVAMTSNAGSGGDSEYRPVVEFEDAAGRTHRITGSVGSNPPAYSVGESAPVLYDGLNPDAAVIDTFTERHLLPLALGGFGAIFAAVGGGLLLSYNRRRRTIERLRSSGMRIDAKVLSCDRDIRVKIGGRSPFRVHAQAKHPSTGRLIGFRSDPIWLDLTDALRDRMVPVWLDMSDSRTYYVDLSEWVDESERA